MLKLEDLQAAIESLPEVDEYARLRRWFSERDWARWDAQVEMDSESGILDFRKDSHDGKAKGTLKKL